MHRTAMPSSSLDSDIDDPGRPRSTVHAFPVAPVAESRVQSRPSTSGISGAVLAAAMSSALVGKRQLLRPRLRGCRSTPVHRGQSSPLHPPAWPSAGWPPRTNSSSPSTRTPQQAGLGLRRSLFVVIPLVVADHVRLSSSAMVPGRRCPMQRTNRRWAKVSTCRRTQPPSDRPRTIDAWGTLHWQCSGMCGGDANG